MPTTRIVMVLALVVLTVVLTLVVVTEVLALTPAFAQGGCQAFGAELAATTAADMSARTDSELHIIHVGEVPLVYHPERHGGYHVVYEEAESRSRRVLEAQVEKVKAAGATVAQAHLKMGRADEEIVELAESMGVGLIVMGTRDEAG